MLYSGGRGVLEGRGTLCGAVCACACVSGFSRSELRVWHTVWLVPLGTGMRFGFGCVPGTVIVVGVQIPFPKPSGRFFHLSLGLFTLYI